MCCGDISSRILQGAPDKYDMFFVGEVIPKKCTDTCLGLNINLIRVLNDEFRVHCRRNISETSGGSLQDFLAREFRGADQVNSDDTITQRILTFKDVSDGTMPMNEKELLG